MVLVCLMQSNSIQLAFSPTIEELVLLPLFDSLVHFSWLRALSCQMGFSFLKGLFLSCFASWKTSSDHRSSLDLRLLYLAAGIGFLVSHPARLHCCRPAGHFSCEGRLLTLTHSLQDSSHFKFDYFIPFMKKNSMDQHHEAPWCYFSWLDCLYH